MIILGILLILFVVSIASSVVEDGLDFYKDGKFWLSLCSLVVLAGLMTQRMG